MIMKLIKHIAASFMRQAEQSVKLRASALNAQNTEVHHEQ